MLLTTASTGLIIVIVQEIWAAVNACAVALLELPLRKQVRISEQMIK